MSTPSSICLICSAPRHGTRDGPYCLYHVRKRDRDRRRLLYSTDPNRPDPEPRASPRGSCLICKAPVKKDGKCATHLKEYKRIWNQAKRKR